MLNKASSAAFSKLKKSLGAMRLRSAFLTLRRCSRFFSFLGLTTNTDIGPTMDLDLARKLLIEADKHVQLPGAPEELRAAIPAALELIRATEPEAAVGTHAEYFRTSRERYACYVAMARVFLAPRARILDVGNAPGHVAFLLNRLGHEVHGINLNAEWRATYPDQRWLELFRVTECDIEREDLPCAPESYDAVLFTEVLEHIAIADPVRVLQKLRTSLKPGGVVLFSTPNVCNISNIVALLHGLNIFWPRALFYGSLDRHNREWTPAEVRSAFAEAGFSERAFFGINDHSNWRTGAAEHAYRVVGELGESHAMLRNTVVGVFSRD